MLTIPLIFNWLNVGLSGKSLLDLIENNRELVKFTHLLTKMLKNKILDTNNCSILFECIDVETKVVCHYAWYNRILSINQNYNINQKNHCFKN